MLSVLGVRDLFMIFHFIRGSTDDNHIVIQFYVSDSLRSPHRVP